MNFSMLSPMALAKRPLWLASFALLCFAWFAPTACAQMQIDVKLSRHTYILYEPLIATISITNLAGRDLTLEDLPGKQWFNIEVTNLDGGVIPPRDPDYKLRPLTIPAGQTLRRQIDITPLFPIQEEGMHRVRANIYVAEADRFFASNFASFDMTDGKLMWRQTVGTPGTGELRQLSLLTHRLPDKLLLYVRVRDDSNNIVYATQSLGRLVLSGNEPQELIDRENNLHVLQEALPGAYIYSQINLDGQRVSQKTYVKSGASRPTLTKTSTGSVEIRGGEIQVAAAKLIGSEATAPQAKLSDRPASVPRAKKGSE